MPSNKIFFVAFIILIIFLIFYLEPKTIEIKIADETFSAEVADNDLMRSRGLMYRAAPSPMLFIFSDSSVKSFWMKNVKFPLDIIWIDADKKILGWDRMLPCESEPCKIYNSPGQIKYVLEVEAGFAEKNKIKVGSAVEIPNL